MSSRRLKIAKNHIGMHMQSWKHEYWCKNHDFLFHLTFTCYILKFCMSQHGGAHGGGRYWLSLDQVPYCKNLIFSATKWLTGAWSAPPCMRKFALPFAPPFSRPSMRPPMIAPPVASKMWVFHENDEYSSTSIAIRNLPPFHAPPPSTYLKTKKLKTKKLLHFHFSLFFHLTTGIRESFKVNAARARLARVLRKKSL